MHLFLQEQLFCLLTLENKNSFFILNNMMLPNVITLRSIKHTKGSLVWWTHWKIITINTLTNQNPEATPGKWLSYLMNWVLNSCFLFCFLISHAFLLFDTVSDTFPFCLLSQSFLLDRGQKILIRFYWKDKKRTKDYMA